MKILAISGSTRKASTNTALLHELVRIAPSDVTISVFDQVATLPIFSADQDNAPLPTVLNFRHQVATADAIIFASPEYVRSLPGGLKNAIDWLVSGDEVIAKPMAILHGSHRGDDMLDALRIVLSTVSTGFSEDTFIRFPLIDKTPTQIMAHFEQPDETAKLQTFLSDVIALAGPRLG